MRHRRLHRVGGWLPLTFVIALGVLLTAIPAQARPLDDSGYSITMLTITNGNSFQTGGTMPIFVATLTVPQGVSMPNPVTLVLLVDGQRFAGDLAGRADNSFTIRTTISNIQAGNHTSLS